MNCINTNNQSKFKFVATNVEKVAELINSLDSSNSPGSTLIPCKVIKASVSKLAPIITYMFNKCLNENKIPNDWKTAVVTPLYKNKGENSDINNYRGISVIPPIAKVFEKILANQIVEFLEQNKILTNDQHGFRTSHSCETALHQIISHMNEVLSNRQIGLYLFVDFKKAFDTVDSNLLLFKLKLYGFDEKSINLISDYFSDRKQYVKINMARSDTRDIVLGVPQGSILGP